MSMTFNTKTVHSKGINELLTGTGTAGTAGSSSAPYVPSLWTFNVGVTPVAGDVFTIKIPVAGVNSGVWMSVNNGTNYYPVAIQGATRFQAEFGVNYILTVVYETGINTTTYGTTKDGAAKGASTSTYTGDRWRVLNFYNTDTNTKVTQTNRTTNATYDMLFSVDTTTTTAKTNSTYKSTNLTYNPGTQVFTNTGAIMSKGKEVFYGDYSASSTPSSPVAGQIWFKDASMTTEEAKPLVVTTTVSSLPTTISDSNITADMEVIKSDIGNPNVQETELTVTTSAGSLTISGTISGSTSITLWLARCR